MSMPSRAYASFLPLIIGIFVVRIYGKGVNALTGLCLISTAVRDAEDQVIMSVNALTGLCLISTYKDLELGYFGPCVSMPSRAYASFLRLYSRNTPFR